MTRILLTGFLFLLSLSLYSQNEIKEINGIKSNINYLYATGTSSTSAEDATNNAKDLIALEIEQWLKENSSDDVAGYAAKSKEKLSQIKTKRGNLYRVFVYVKKSDVLPFYKEEEVMVVDFVEPQIVEKSDNIQTRETVTNVDSVAIIEVKMPLKEKTDSIVNNITKDDIPVYSPSAKEKILLSLRTFLELNEYINQGRESQDIQNVGNYKNLPSTGSYYLFIHNREGNITACLKMEDSKFINLSNGKDDAITNYKGCGAIWIEYKSK